MLVILLSVVLSEGVVPPLRDPMLVVGSRALRSAPLAWFKRPQVVGLASARQTARLQHRAHPGEGKHGKSARVCVCKGKGGGGGSKQVV